MITAEEHLAAKSMAEKLVARDAETPENVKRIEVGRAGLVLLAKAYLDAMP